MRNTGFTLVEVLIVLVILGILFAIVTPQFLGESRSRYNYNNNSSVAIPAIENDERPSITYGDKQLFEMKVLVPFDCSQIKEVIYTTSAGERKRYKVEVDAAFIVTPSLSLVEILWEPLDWRQLSGNAVVLCNDSKSLRLLHDLKKREQ